MFIRYHLEAHEYIGKKALSDIAGLGFTLLTNTDSDTFWYADKKFKKRYKQEAAQVGDHFWDGNNGDKHTVVAVDLENERLVYRNEDQNEELLNIACWW